MNTFPRSFDLTISSFRLAPHGLTPLGTPTYAEWLTCGQFIRATEHAVQFWIGDWLLYGECAYGKTDYEQAVQDTGLSYQTLRIYKYVAAAFPVSLRRNNLSFHHHKEVANLPPELQTRLLHQAETEGWPLLKLKQEKYRLNLEAARPAVTPADPGFLLGDCLQLLATLPPNCVDLVVTAPASAAPTDLTRIASALSLLAAALKTNSHLYLFTSWQTYPALVPIMQQQFTVKNVLVWEKSIAAETAPTAYQQTYECILFAQKGRRHLLGRRDASVLSFAALPDASRSYPHEKPLPLLKYLIEKSSLPGEVICDPFAGVAATLLAAKQTGRRYLGIEQDAHWYQEGCHRLALA